MKPRKPAAARRDHRYGGTGHVTRIDDDGRTCNLCGVYKPWPQFYRTKQSYTGHVGTCKPCHAEKMRAYRKEASKPPPPIIKPANTLIHAFLTGRPAHELSNTGL